MELPVDCDCCLSFGVACCLLRCGLLVVRFMFCVCRVLLLVGVRCVLFVACFVFVVVVRCVQFVDCCVALIVWLVVRL